MNLSIFCEKISLPGEGKKIILQIEREISPEKYQSYCEAYRKDYRFFIKQVREQQNYRQLFLYLYCKMACDTYETYQEKKIPEEIFWDTFYDITLWCKACFEEYGEYGIDEYNWFFRHINLTIFRLGRLEFEKMPSPYDLQTPQGSVKKGQDIISIHIPEGDKLTPEVCRESIEEGRRFWGEKYIYFCHSWLLFPGLSKLLDSHSNILKFQELFSIREIDYQEREAEWRIFGTVKRVISQYPENTSLQKKAKEYLLSDHALGRGFGILK